jgi:integrase
MTGHVRRRGKSSWELKYDAGQDPRTRRRLTRYSSFKGTKRAAELELTRLISEHNAGASVDPSKISVREFLERWDREHAAMNCTPKTLERYRQLVRIQVVPHIGNVAVQKLRPAHLTGLYATLPTAGLSARTVGHVHRLLHHALKHAGTWGVAQQNVAALVNPPKVTAEEIMILTQEQIGQLLRRLEGRTLRPIVSLALASGARRGELLALRVKDFNPGTGTIRIERSLEQTKAGLRFKSPKTRNGRRTIALPPSIVAELKGHLLKLRERRLSLGLGREPEDALLFPRWDGGIRTPHWFTQKFAQVMAAMKIAGVTLHSLRHTHASQLIAEGLDVLTISRRLGHASPTITLSVYGHLFKEHRRPRGRDHGGDFRQDVITGWQSGGNFRGDVQETQ